MLNFKQYPQFEFAKEIIELINPSHNALLIDAPCGNGETTYILSAIEKLKVIGYDISKHSIDNAKYKFQRKNLEYKVADIFEVFKHHLGVDYFCMINSLFLLNKQDEIIENIHKILTDKGNVFFIIPNISGINYINFKKNNPHVNSIELDKNDFIRYIEKFNFKLVIHKPICYANIYGRKELRFFSVLSPFYLRVLNFFMTAFKIGTPSYHLFSFQRG